MNNLEIKQNYVGEKPSFTDEIKTLKENFTADMIEAAPDLATNNLADKITASLFEQVASTQDANEQTILQAGKEIFYRVGKNTLGPIAVSFVDQVLKDCQPGYVVFPARDATPFFHIAERLLTLKADQYDKNIKIVNPVFNRKTWGVDDEQDADSPVSQVTDPLVLKMLGQIGFDSEEHVTFVEVGCWGTMIDSFKSAMASGKMPEEDFSVFFLFTHMPEHIYGYLNKNAGTTAQDGLEAIADSFECLPKYFKRPTSFYEEDGQVKPLLQGKVIDSPFLKAWSEAAIEGFVESASEFCSSKQTQSPDQMIKSLHQLSKIAQLGYFNGMLPSHTETWSEGEDWRQAWKWGPTLPLIPEKSDV